MAGGAQCRAQDQEHPHRLARRPRGARGRRLDRQHPVRLSRRLPDRAARDAGPGVPAARRRQQELKAVRERGRRRHSRGGDRGRAGRDPAAAGTGGAASGTGGPPIRHHHPDRRRLHAGQPRRPGNHLQQRQPDDHPRACALPHDAGRRILTPPGRPDQLRPLPVLWHAVQGGARLQPHSLAGSHPAHDRLDPLQGSGQGRQRRAEHRHGRRRLWRALDPSRHDGLAVEERRRLVEGQRRQETAGRGRARRFRRAVLRHSAPPDRGHPPRHRRSEGSEADLFLRPGAHPDPFQPRPVLRPHDRVPVRPDSGAQGSGRRGRPDAQGHHAGGIAVLRRQVDCGSQARRAAAQAHQPPGARALARREPGAATDLPPRV